MIRIVDGRDTGKTKKLLEECSRTGGIYVCAHPERVLEKCRAYGLDYWKILPMGYKDFILKKYTQYGDNIYIDELELLTKELIRIIDGNNTLAGYTVTMEDKED